MRKCPLIWLLTVKIGALGHHIPNYEITLIIKSVDVVMFHHVAMPFMQQHILANGRV